MAKLSTDELLDAFKEMTLLELSDFVKKFEETFEVTAAAPEDRRSPSNRLKVREHPGDPRRRTRQHRRRAPA